MALSFIQCGAPGPSRGYWATLGNDNDANVPHYIQHYRGSSNFGYACEHYDCQRMYSHNIQGDIAALFSIMETNLQKGRKGGDCGTEILLQLARRNKENVWKVLRGSVEVPHPL